MNKKYVVDGEWLGRKLDCLDCQAYMVDCPGSDDIEEGICLRNLCNSYPDKLVPLTQSQERAGEMLELLKRFRSTRPDSPKEWLSCLMEMEKIVNDLTTEEGE